MLTHNPSTTNVTAATVDISANHPLLTATDPESIRLFLRRYDQCATTMLSRTCQFATETLTSETIIPVDLKFCLDPEFLEYQNYLELIKDAISYAELTNEQVRAFLKN